MKNKKQNQRAKTMRKNKGIKKIKKFLKTLAILIAICGLVDIALAEEQLKKLKQIHDGRTITIDVATCGDSPQIEEPDGGNEPSGQQVSVENTDQCIR